MKTITEINKNNQSEANLFKFASYAYVPETATAYLRYQVDRILFEEKITFTDASRKLTPAQLKAIHHCLYYLHLAAGVSYYKAFIPKRIKIETRPMSQKTAAFFENFYLKGLGEFSVRNGIDLRKRINFPYSSTLEPFPLQLKLNRKTAVPIGGGKDSIVSLEIVKFMNEEFVGLSVGNHKPIQEVAHIADIPLIKIERNLSPRLFRLNETGALNGHVPITGILSFIFVIAAIIYDFDTIAMSNERSANIGNIQFKGMEINHQWSKSQEFEVRFRDLLKSEICPNIKYFSILREFSELYITRLFSNLHKYHAHFSSCNNAYKITDQTEKKWCGDCDKCRFVFLILAPFIDKEALINIFETNLFEKPAKKQKFEALLGLKGHKPFECVGEIEESTAAWTLVNENPQWNHTRMIRELAQRIKDVHENPRKNIDNSFQRENANSIPNRFREAVDAFILSQGEECVNLGGRHRRRIGSSLHS